MKRGRRGDVRWNLSVVGRTEGNDFPYGLRRAQRRLSENHREDIDSNMAVAVAREERQLISAVPFMSGSAVRMQSKVERSRAAGTLT